MGLPVAIYARFSTDKQDSRSTEDQIRRCRRFAEQNGYEVVSVYEDQAISGAHAQRPGLQQLLLDARSRTARKFISVLVDDQSRIARDLGVAVDIIFRELPAAGVNLIDCSNGMSSDDRRSRMMFGMNALVNDAFLEMVRHETHRGMEGRALAGFSTGGRTYGFDTKLEDKPSNPEHPRSIVVVDPEQAAVVNKVFSLYLDGLNIGAIAAKLNDEGIAAPHDGGLGNKKSRGWSHSTIRYMLSNERYIGRLVWNQSKWVRVPGTKQRRRIDLPKEEWVIRDNPELAIIDQGIWNRVQEKLDSRKKRDVSNPKGAGRPHSNNRVLAGLLQCGVCGGGFVVLSNKFKNGVRYPSLGCNIHKSRGASICSNGRCIGEKKLLKGIAEYFRKLLRHPDNLNRFVEGFVSESKKRREQSVDVKQYEKTIAEAESKIRKLAAAIAVVDDSTPLLEQLKIEQTRAKSAQAALATSLAAARNIEFSPVVIRKFIDKVISALEAGLAGSSQIPQARETLSMIGPIRMTPEEKDGVWYYRAEGAIGLSLLLGGDLSHTSSSGTEDGEINKVAGARNLNYLPNSFAWIHWMALGAGQHLLTSLQSPATVSTLA